MHWTYNWEEFLDCCYMIPWFLLINSFSHLLLLCGSFSTCTYVLPVSFIRFRTILCNIYLLMCICVSTCVTPKKLRLSKFKKKLLLCICYNLHIFAPLESSEATLLKGGIICSHAILCSSYSLLYSQILVDLHPVSDFLSRVILFDWLRIIPFNLFKMILSFAKL